MTITALPPAPSPTDTPAQFNTKAFAFVAALDQFVTETNATALAVNADAATATDQAGIATAQAGIATTKADEASASVALAKDWATKTSDEVVAGQGFGAKKYANDAALSAAAAAASALEAAGLVENYQGALAADPTLDKDGNPLAAGDWYINTATGFIRAYNGSAWVQGISVVAGVSSLNGLTGELTGFVTETGAQTLTNKTLVDPKLTLGGTNGTAGQVPISQGDGLPPVWSDVGGGGVQQFTASGSITAGTAVHVNSNGTASAPTLSIATTTGSTATVSTTSSVDNTIVWHPGIECYVAFWIRSSDSYVVGSIGTPASDGSVAWSSETVIYSTASSDCHAVYYPSESKILVAITTQAQSLLALAVTATTTTLTAGSASSSGSSNSNPGQGGIAYDATAGKAVVSYRASGRGAVRVVTLSGTTVTWGSESDFGSQIYEPNIFYHPGAGKCLVFGRYTNNDLYGFVLTVSGTTVSWGSAQLLDTIGEPGQQMGFAYSTAAEKAVVTFRNATTYDNVRTAVLSVSGSTLSLGSVVEITTGDHGTYTAVVYDAYTDKVVAFYLLDSTTYLATRTGTISGTSISWSSETTLFSGSANNRFAVAYDSVNYRSNVIFRSGSTLYSKTVKSGSSTITSTNFVGFAESTVSNGQTFNATCVGGANENVSGLTAGSKYYVTSTGGLSASNTGIYGGLALSATKILVKG